MLELGVVYRKVLTVISCFSGHTGGMASLHIWSLVETTIELAI